MNDAHERAMREAANGRDYLLELPNGYGRHGTAEESNKLRALIREQVRRMDERCVSKWNNGHFMLTKHGGPVPVSASYCPTCGKRIEVVEDGK